MLNNFSPNMIKTYFSCPKKYYFRYVENINVPQSSLPFEKGKKIHALANYYLQKIKIDRIETTLNKTEREVWELLKQNPFYNMECVKSEFTLSIKLSFPTACGDFPLQRDRNLDEPNLNNNQDFWLGGRLDAIVHSGNDYYILDYKTGSVPQNPQYDPQTMIYLLCADRFIKDYNNLSFVYIDLKKKQNHIIEFNLELKSKYEQGLLKICNQIKSDTIFECKHNDCKYCEFNKICKI